MLLCTTLERAKRSLALTCALFTHCGVLVLGSSCPASAETLLNLEGGAFHDNNLTRAQNRPDVRADRAVAILGSVGKYFALTGADGVTLTAALRSEVFDRYEGLSHTVISAASAWRHKFGLGFDAPWVLLSGTVSHDDYRDPLRDSRRVELQIELGKRWTETIDASLGAFFERRYADNSEPAVPGISGRVFDLQGRGAFVRAAYAATDRLLFDARFAVRRGDVESTSQRSLQVFLASDAIAQDPTFGVDLYAYRLPGTTKAATVALSWALNERASFNAAFADERTSAAQGLRYRSRITSASFAYHY